MKHEQSNVTDERQRRYVSVIERLGGDVTVKQVAEAVGWSGKLEIIREELRAMSGSGLIFMTKGAGGRYTVSLATRQAAREESAAIAKTRTVVNASHGGKYDGADLRPIPGLPQSRLVALSLPSRVGNRLYHRDGRMEAVE